MNKNDFEIKSIVYIMVLSYILNLLFSILGYACEHISTAQLLIYQVGNAFAITAAVMAGRYTGMRGEHVAASAFILLGIVHGISLAALSRESINVDSGMKMIIPLGPALICMFWCNLYPLWLRISGIIPIIFFTIVYVNVIQGGSYFGLPLSLGFVTLQILELLWSLFLLKDWRLNKQTL